MDFIDGKVSSRKAITLLARNGIEVNDEEAAVILNFYTSWQRSITKKWL
jgi:hypothetical protein